MPFDDRWFEEMIVVDVTRRSLLGAGAAGLAAASVLSAEARAAAFGNPDEPRWVPSKPLAPHLIETFTVSGKSGPA